MLGKTVVATSDHAKPDQLEQTAAKLNRSEQTAAVLRMQLMLKDWRLRHLRERYKVCRDDYTKLDVALNEECAAKISLQQDAVLRSAQQAAFMRRRRIVGVTIGLGFSGMAATTPLVIQHLYGFVPSVDAGECLGAPRSRGHSGIFRRVHGRTAYTQQDDPHMRCRSMHDRCRPRRHLRSVCPSRLHRAAQSEV
jgi:hypothetical protein